MPDTKSRIRSLPLAISDGYPLRLLISFAVLASIALYFWTQSRIPALDDKAPMSGSIVLEDPLSFEARYPIDPADPLWKRIAYTAVNWGFTNRVGMTFGVCFGAAFLTMLRHLSRRGFRNGFANALLGFFTGAPLGVCVNCAAPIARGLFAGGATLESVLAAMIASPTFNVIVVSMVFGLFPLYLAAIKLGLTFFVIAVVIPVIVHLVPGGGADRRRPARGLPGRSTARAHGARIARVGAMGLAREYAQDLWFVLRTTVPWMLVAGILGAVVANLIPVQTIQTLPVNTLTLIAGTNGLFLRKLTESPISALSLFFAFRKGPTHLLRNRRRDRRRRRLRGAVKRSRLGRVGLGRLPVIGEEV